MAIDNPAGWLQNAGTTHTAEQMRTYVGGMLSGLAASGAVTRTAGGINPALGTAMVVTQNGTPNMTVNVGAGVAYIPGSESANQGVYAVRAGSVTNLGIATAPGAGLNRIDLVVAKVQDSVYSGATDAWSLAVVTGTASGSPSAPTAPNNSLVLAQVFVGANVTSIVTANITDKRNYVGAVGGHIRSTSTTRPTVLYDGLSIYESDTHFYSWSDGSSWFPITQWVQGQNIFVLPTTTNNHTSTTYVNVVIDSTTRTISMTKRYASTRLKVSFDGSCVQPNSTVFLGVNINSTDFDIRRGGVFSSIANNHLPANGTRYISGISAGALTCTARVKSTAGTVSWDTNDTFSFTIEEVQ